MTITAILRMTNEFLTNLFTLAKLAASDTTTAGVLNAAFLGLFKSWGGFGPVMPAASAVEPQFAGYARKPVTFGAPALDTNGRVSLVSTSVSFAPTDNLLSEGVIGCALFDAATLGNILGACIFGRSFTFHNTTDALQLTLAISAPPVGPVDWGQVTAVR